MDAKHDLHLGRLRDALAKLEDIQRLNAHDPGFQSWKDRIGQSLRQLFEEKNDYIRRFLRLQFWDVRMSIGPDPSLSGDDQRIFQEDLEMTRQILRDAIEELEIAPPDPTPRPGTGATAVRTAAPIVINVQNVLAQTSHFQFSQVIANLDTLGLTPEERRMAEVHGKELETEIKGQQRWSNLAKPLEALKSMRKSVYENVALPLLLEMLKKQAGL